MSSFTKLLSVISLSDYLQIIGQSSPDAMFIGTHLKDHFIEELKQAEEITHLDLFNKNVRKKQISIYLSIFFVKNKSKAEI